jgi:hypothetical protein
VIDALNAKWRLGLARGRRERADENVLAGVVLEQAGRR